MYRKFVSVFLFFLLSLNMLNAQTFHASMLDSALEQIKDGNNEQAVQMLKEILSDKKQSSLYPSALYWLVKADTVLGEYDEASRAADNFLVDYPGHRLTEEIKYQRGKLFFYENEPEKCMQELSSFITEYPDSGFVSLAYYWVGESLVKTGNLEKAYAVFDKIIQDYPYSAKIEASRYRKTEITLMYQQQQLLELLKWNHEEYLNDSENFYRKEKEYRNIIDEYSKHSENNLQKERLLELKEQVLELQQYYLREYRELLNAE